LLSLASMLVTTTFCIIARVSLALIVTNAPLIIYFRHWCKEKVTTPVMCIQDLHSNMLYDGWMSITSIVTRNACRLKNKSISMVPTTYFGDPSHALTVIVLINMWIGSTDISSNTCFESTFKAKPLSINTLLTVQS
jgi:hypothetical protein